jgi:pyroglutamyl-peptidase
VDLDQVLVKWRIQPRKGVDLKTSNDVGNYVCGFVYYTSLEYFWNKRERDDTPVVFMHVPPLEEKDDVEKGVEATVGLIRALAESLRQ